ncbi:hypothetical protein V6L78_29550 [Pseudomonas canadensis]|uniref:hypothetical protein n=1 Tax=Pseudomonas canadensis TaxID=915099 RepID=UPI0030D4815B
MGFSIVCDAKVLFARVGIDNKLESSLRVDNSISPANTLTLQERVPLDGSITLDLLYL